MIFSATLVAIFVCFSSADGAGLKVVNIKDERVLVDSSPYAVILRDTGLITNRSNLFYGFLEDKFGAEHIYQFNSFAAVAAGRANAVWLFKEGKQCVPNSAVVYNGVLYCRLWTNKYSEYNHPMVSSRSIKPVTIAAFKLDEVPTAPTKPCDKVEPAVHEAPMAADRIMFERLPPSSRSRSNHLDKFDVQVKGPNGRALQRPNMNVRFHADNTGLWIMAPHQEAVFYNPRMRRFRVDPDTLAQSRVQEPAGIDDTTPMIMMSYGIGVVVDGLYYGLARTGQGTVWFSQRPTSKAISMTKGPFSSEKDANYLLIDKLTQSEYVSTIQFNPLTNEVSYAVKDLNKPGGGNYKHIIVPVSVDSQPQKHSRRADGYDDY